MKLHFCVACGDRKQLIHHSLVPPSRGGHRVDENIITLCRSCTGKAGLRLSFAELIAAGQQAARARGVIFGRKPKLDRHQVIDAIKRRDAGELLRDIAKRYGVSTSMISRLPGRDLRH
jgi:hypothetical protein